MLNGYNHQSVIDGKYRSRFQNPDVRLQHHLVTQPTPFLAIRGAAQPINSTSLEESIDCAAPSTDCCADDARNQSIVHTYYWVR